MPDVLIRPFRDYDEHDVVNLFAMDSGTAYKGTLVKATGSGWLNNQADFELNAAGNSYANVVSDRYSVQARVTAAGTGDSPLGMLLHDVAETDENGEKYIYNPWKAKANDISYSGQAVPILTRGLVLYSGVIGSPSSNGWAYADGTGRIRATDPTPNTNGGTKVGKFLGVQDTDGYVLLRLDL